MAPLPRTVLSCDFCFGSFSLVYTSLSGIRDRESGARSKIVSTMVSLADADSDSRDRGGQERANAPRRSSADAGATAIWEWQQREATALDARLRSRELTRYTFIGTDARRVSGR